MKREQSQQSIQGKSQYVVLQGSEQDLKKSLLEEQKKSQSLAQKNPILFRWMTAALVMGSASAILLVLNMIVLYSIVYQDQISINLTFLTYITEETKILTQKTELINLSNNFQTIFGQTKFEHANLVGQFKQLSQTDIVEKIYRKQDEKLLYLFQMQNSAKTDKGKFALFMNGPFPVPNQENFNTNTTYYSFQIKEQRKSAIISLSQKDKYLKFVNEHIESPLKCKTYNFQTGKDEGVSFRLLNDTLTFDLVNKGINVNVSSNKCFFPLLSQEEYAIRLFDILGMNTTSEELSLLSVEVYHLQ